jgi:hypothetical protein
VEEMVWRILGIEIGKGLTFAVIAEAHFGLAQANCVFSGADAIEFLELGLVDTLWVVKGVW